MTHSKTLHKQRCVDKNVFSLPLSPYLECNMAHDLKTVPLTKTQHIFIYKYMYISVCCWCQKCLEQQEWQNQFCNAIFLGVTIKGLTYIKYCLDC